MKQCTPSIIYIISLQKKKSSFFLNRKKSQSNFQIFNDQLSRKVKNVQYKNSNYAIELESESSYMYKFTSDIININRKFCRTLLKKKQTISQNALFRDDLFDETCRKIQDRNEIIIIQNIDLLTVFFCSDIGDLRCHSFQSFLQNN